jgi:chromate transporter
VEKRQNTAAAHDAGPRPDLRALFLGFSSVGLSGFGGVLPFARRMLVDERRWMSEIGRASCRERVS